MKAQLFFAITLAALALPALAAPETFDMKDPGNTSKIGFKLDAPAEKIAGTATNISGTVTFDPADPGATRGKIIVGTASLIVPNAMQASIMHGKQWLDAASNPEITFEVKDLKNTKSEGTNITADVTGTFTLHGVSKEVTFPVRMSYLKDKLGERTKGGQQGDLLVITSSDFSIKRADYKINPGQYLDKVADTISLNIAVVGACPK